MGSFDSASKNEESDNIHDDSKPALVISDVFEREESRFVLIQAPQDREIYLVFLNNECLVDEAKFSLEINCNCKPYKKIKTIVSFSKTKAYNRFKFLPVRELEPEHLVLKRYINKEKKQNNQKDVDLINQDKILGSDEDVKKRNDDLNEEKNQKDVDNVNLINQDKILGDKIYDGFDKDVKKEIKDAEVKFEDLNEEKKQNINFFIGFPFLDKLFGPVQKDESVMKYLRKDLRMNVYLLPNISNPLFFVEGKDLYFGVVNDRIIEDLGKQYEITVNGLKYNPNKSYQNGTILLGKLHK